MVRDYYKKIRPRYEKKPAEYWNLMARKYKNADAVLVPGDVKLKNKYFDYNQRRVLLKLFDKFPRGSKILDVGCGVGRWSIELARRGMDVVGVDLSREMIAVAKTRAKKLKLNNIKFFQSAADEINFPKNSFDYVLSITVLQHILDNKKRKKAISRMVEVTKPNGKLVILEKVRSEKIKEFHVMSYPMEKWKNLFEKCGARLIETHGLDVSLFVNWLNYFATGFKYRTQLKTYPGLESVEESANSFVRCVYTFLLSLAIILSFPIDLLSDSIFKKFSNHLLMVFEKL